MKPIGEYTKALWRCVVLFLAGVALQWFLGPANIGGKIWIYLILIIGAIVVLYLLKSRWNFAKSISGPESRIVTIAYLLALLLICGLGFNGMHASWIFVLPLTYFTIILGLQSIADLKIKKWSATPLFHWSLLIILLAGIFGAGSRETAFLQINEGETQNVAMDDEGNPVPLPFSIKLEDFQMEEYEGTHQPKEFLSKIQIISDKGSRLADVRVNHPSTVGSWKIYQTDYDVSKGNDSEYSVLSVVRDPMWPFTKIGLWGLLIGCVLMFFEKAARKEAKA